MQAGTTSSPGHADMDEPGIGHYLLVWQARGHAWVLQGGRRARLEPGTALLIDGRRPHTIRYISRRHDEMVLAIPCDKLDAHVGRVDDLTVKVFDTDEPASRLLVLLLGLIRRETQNRPLQKDVSLSDALTSVVAAALRELPGGCVREPSMADIYRIECLSRYVRSLLPDADVPVCPAPREPRRSGSTALLH